MISLTNHDSSEGEQWGRYNLPSIKATQKRCRQVFPGGYRCFFPHLFPGVQLFLFSGVAIGILFYWFWLLVVKGHPTQGITRKVTMDYWIHTLDAVLLMTIIYSLSRQSLAMFPMNPWPCGANPKPWSETQKACVFNNKKKLLNKGLLLAPT